MLGRTETWTRDMMYCQTIRTVIDISWDDRAGIATYILRRRLNENYSIDYTVPSVTLKEAYLVITKIIAFIQIYTHVNIKITCYNQYSYNKMYCIYQCNMICEYLSYCVDETILHCYNTRCHIWSLITFNIHFTSVLSERTNKYVCLYVCLSLLKSNCCINVWFS